MARKEDGLDNEEYLQSRDSQVEETFSENMFIEVYDESKGKWYVVCPFVNQIYLQYGQLYKYFQDNGYLYVLASQSMRSYETRS